MVLAICHDHRSFVLWPSTQQYPLADSCLPIAKTSYVNGTRTVTLQVVPETNIAPQNGLNTSFLLGRPIFRGNVSFRGSMPSFELLTNPCNGFTKIHIRNPGRDAWEVEGWPCPRATRKRSGHPRITSAKLREVVLAAGAK